MKLPSLKLPSKKEVVEYLRKQSLAQFIGFYIGISSTGLVSHFFETRNFSNLWGIFSTKTLIEEDTFNVLEKIIAVVIGFIVFEIVSKNLQPLIDRFQPIKTKLVCYGKEHGWDVKGMALLLHLNTKRKTLFNAASDAIRATIKKYISK